MAKFACLELMLPIEVDGQLWKKLADYAERRGITIEEAFQSVGTLGLYTHLSENLDYCLRHDV